MATNPKVIGHELVRQYYTTLHDDPEQLHRFFLDKSTFVHAPEASPEEGAVGQQAIDAKIKELNYIDCRVRVRQVDSHTSINDSIVVQVVGECSNNSEPMRPFVQTFVLVREEEKHYYVHNAIFRYQDHIVASEDVSGEVIMPPQPVHTSNGVQTEHATFYEQDIGSCDGIASDAKGAEPAQAKVVPNSQATPEPVEDVAPTAENGVARIEEKTASQESPNQISWAQRAGGKKTGGAPAPTTEPAQGSSVPSQNGTRRLQKETNRAAIGEKTGRAVPATNGSRAPTGRTARDIPDDQQVFVGNLPNNTEPEEIKKVFSGYGNVLDVRMTPKRFCFVAFDSVEVVNTLLQKAKAAHANGEKLFELNGYRLNVEEKQLPNRSEKQLPSRSAGNSGRGGRSGFSGRGGRGGRESREGFRR